MAEEAVQQGLDGMPAAEPEKKARAKQTRVYDGELQIIERIMRELQGLEPDDAGRIIRYVADRIGIEIDLAGVPDA